MIVHNVHECDLCPMRFQLSGALLVHKLNIHTGCSPVDISNILAEVQIVETLSASDAAFDYTIQFSISIHRGPKIVIKNEPIEDNCEEILGNVHIDVPENMEMETNLTDVLDCVKVEVPESNLSVEHTEKVERHQHEITAEGYCYTCDICGATFSNYYNGIKEHLNSHENSCSESSSTSAANIKPDMWSVVQTYDNVKGWELSAVPNNWLTAKGKCVFWPTSKNKSTLLKLATDPNSKPKATWSKIQCRMKRINISSFIEADSLVDHMSGGSSSERIAEATNKKSIRTKSQPLSSSESIDELNSLMTFSHPSLLPQSTAKSLGVASTQTTSTQSDDQTDQEFADWQNDSSQSNGQNIVVHANDGLDANIAQLIFRELTKITKHLASQQTSLDMFLGHIATHPSGKSIARFKFIKIESKSQLREFDGKLEEKTFRSNLMGMLRQNINMGRCGEDKMLAALDILCTKDFQAQCTWTGTSRKGPKTAIMSHPKFVDLFMEIGSSATELINPEKIAAFFMKKLKNATKRMLATGQRQSSRHNVPKRTRISAEKIERSEQKIDEGDSVEVFSSGVDTSDEN